MKNRISWKYATFSLLILSISSIIYITVVLQPQNSHLQTFIDSLRTEKLLYETELGRTKDRLKIHENDFTDITERNIVEERIFKLEANILEKAKTVENLQIVMDKIFLHSPNLIRFPCLFPIRPGESSISSTFGNRVAPKTGASKNHKGIDYAAPIGTPVYAPANGLVTEVALNAGGYGKKIVVRHDFGFETVYGHLSGFKVERGDSVKIGKVIAYVGNTGISTGPHLHYEIRKNGSQIDPMEFTRIVERKLARRK